MGIDAYIKAAMDASLERQVLIKVGNLGPSQYLFKYERTLNGLKRYMEHFKAQIAPPLNFVGHNYIFYLDQIRCSDYCVPQRSLSCTQ